MRWSVLVNGGGCDVGDGWWVVGGGWWVKVGWWGSNIIGRIHETSFTVYTAEIIADVGLRLVGPLTPPHLGHREIIIIMRIVYC